MSGCIEWEGYRERKGYGKRANRYAHRMAWEEAHGPIPDGMYVCHHCDNRACINIEHLFLGTATDNNHDRDTKGRGNAPRGEAHRCAKLTEDDVRAIRTASPRDWASMTQLAATYGVTASAIYSCTTGRSWKSVK